MEGKRLGFRRLLPYLRRRKRRLIAGLLLSPVYSGIALLIPWLFRDLLLRLEELDSAAVTSRSSSSPFSGATQVLILIGSRPRACAASRYGTRLLLDRALALRRGRAAPRPLRAPRHGCRSASSTDARIGDLIQRSTQDIELLRFMAGPTLFFGASVALVLPGALVLLFSLSAPIRRLRC
jgi:ABC-type multidrug transport system fused ATPase/permease subunit